MADPTWEDTEPVEPEFDETAEVLAAPTGGEVSKPPVLFGPEAAQRAFDEEWASRPWWERLLAGIGTAVENPALRLKQGAAKLGIDEPIEEATSKIGMAKISPKQYRERVEGTRQIGSKPLGIAGNVIGNVAMLGPAGARLAASKTMAGLPAAARVASRTAVPAVAGAGVALGTTPTLEGESELDTAAVGALGGTLGAAGAKSISLALKGAGALWRGLVSNPQQKASREAVERLTEALRADGIDPREFLEKAGRMATDTGKPVTLADMVGDDVAAVNTRKLFREAMETAEGPERAALARGVHERTMGQRERVLEDLSGTMGTSKVPRSEAFEVLAKEKQAAADPLYKAAFANDRPILDENIVDLFNRPAMQTAFKEMMKDAANRGEKIPTMVWAGDAEPPAMLVTGEFKEGVPIIYTPTIKMLDSIKKKLYDVEQAAHTPGIAGTPKSTESSRAITGVRRELTKILDEDVAPPEYKQARKIWGDYAEMEQSFKNGIDIFKHDPAAIGKILKESSPAERDAFASGIFAQINEMSSKEGLDWAGNNLLRDTRKMAQLRAAFGPGEEAGKQFDKFKKMLQAESNAMRTARTMLPHSRTLHAAGMAPGEVASMVKDAGQGNALSFLMKALRAATGRDQGMSKRGAGKIAQVGFTPIPRLSRRKGSTLGALTRTGVGEPPGALEMSAVPVLPVSPLESIRLQQGGGDE